MFCTSHKRCSIQTSISLKFSLSPVTVLSLDVQHNTRDDVANITFNDDDGMMITGTEIYTYIYIYI